MKSFHSFLVLLFLGSQFSFSQVEAFPRAKTYATQNHTPIMAQYYDPSGATLDTLSRENNSWGNGLLNYQLVEDYDAGNWVPRVREYFFYDGNDQIITDSVQGYLNQVWQNVNLFTYTYDNLENQTYFINYGWMNNAWDTIFATKNEYTYHSSNEWETRDDFQWQPGFGFFPTFSTVNHFNSLTAEIDSLDYYTTQQGVWERVAKLYDIVWNDFGDRLYDTYYYQGYQGGLPLMNTNRYSFFFTNPYNYEVFREEDSGNGFDTLNRSVFEADSYNNRTLNEEYGYNVTNPGLYFGEKFIHVYNSNGQLESTLTQVFDLNSGYVDRDYVEYFFSPVSAPEPTLPNLHASVYPQPGNATLYLRLEDETRGELSLEITDLSGRVLKQNRFPHLGGESDYPLYVSDLASGTYLLQARLNDKRLAKRIVIQ